MIVRAFITHKLSENYADCQDRFGINPNNKSIALSDGMGATWQQKIWAQLLVDKFVENNDWLPTNDSIKPLCSLWREKVMSFIQELKENNAPENVIYRNERCLAERRSAGATFVGIRFSENKWNGAVLGDSCLIEWNGTDALFHTSQEIEEFDSYPDYFDSDDQKIGKGIPQVISGELLKGNYLFLVSDPFSDFLLKHCQQGDIVNYINELITISSHGEFECLVENWRKGGMNNDDTTLVIIENDGATDSEVLLIQEKDDINDLINSEKEGKEKAETKNEENQKNHLESPEIHGIINDCDTTDQPVDTETIVKEFVSALKKALPKSNNLGDKKRNKSDYFWKAAKYAFLSILDKYTFNRKKL